MERSARPRERRAHSALLLAPFAAAWLLGAPSAPPAFAFEDADVHAMVLNDRPASDFPGHGGVWMGIDREVKVDGMGNAEITEHWVARIYDASWAKQHFAPRIMPYWSASQGVRPERIRVWKSPSEFTDFAKSVLTDERDPRAADAKPYLGLRRVLLQLDGLVPGDVLELRWKHVDNVVAGELNVRWGRIDFGAEDPVIEQHVSLMVPDALEPRFAAGGPNLIRQRNALGEFKSWTWISGNLPARPGTWLDETYSRFPLSPATAEAPDSLFPYVEWTTVNGWKFGSDYFGRRWEGFAAERDAGMSLTTSKLIANASQPRERALALEQYVQEEIRTVDLSAEFFGLRPIDAAEVYRAGAGAPRDKCLLLYSLLRGAGLKATPVFVPSRTRASADSVACFSNRDRLLVRVLTDDAEPLWLDPLESRSALPAGSGLLIPPRAEQDVSPEIPFPGRAARR